MMALTIMAMTSMSKNQIVMSTMAIPFKDSPENQTVPRMTARTTSHGSPREPNSPGVMQKYAKGFLRNQAVLLRV